ncbi:MAG: alkyl sulfatase dimerization domain-containing protein [Pseudomonadota bacterium]
MAAHPLMQAHNAQFERQHVLLGGCVHGFIGYAASNVYVIEGQTELCIVDTTESTGAATSILRDLREITDKPIKQILYTHSHRDHISGASVFAADGTPDIIAWHGFSSDIIGDLSGPQKAILRRTRGQFGIGLSFPGERVNLGCGPGDRPMEGLGAGHLPPTDWITEPDTLYELAGRDMRLLHIPGETPDHMLVWFEDKKLLISGDNFYHAFPNLYPIRGSRYRDFAARADGLDAMVALQPETLCPGHTLPVTGRAEISDRLTSTAAAIRYVMDVTEAGMIAGTPLDVIVAEAALPESLTRKPWLAPLYGRLDWAIRAYATGTVGWFDGHATNIGRLPPKDEARRIVELAGGIGAVWRAAQSADDPQWQLELLDRLDALGEDTTGPRKAALTKLADAQINPTARNYYLVTAQALEASAP